MKVNKTKLSKLKLFISKGGPGSGPQGGDGSSSVPTAGKRDKLSISSASNLLQARGMNLDTSKSEQTPKGTSYKVTDKTGTSSWMSAKEIHSLLQTKDLQLKKAVTPSPAQAIAGNYKKDHTSFNGLQLTIENPKGSVRKGIDKDGTPWQTEMKDHYGYFKGILGKDKDQLDLFLNPDAKETNTDIFVINQVNPETGDFDEHKIMVGYNNENAATTAYNRNYEEGWSGLGSVTKLSLEEFKNKIAEGIRFNNNVEVVKMFNKSKLLKLKKVFTK